MSDSADVLLGRYLEAYRDMHVATQAAAVAKQLADDAATRVRDVEKDLDRYWEKQKALAKMEARGEL